ncbi:hypothetical protein OEZ86_003877 [Tetradesmus obliquus]|nr:hypothetical protein OEZ86_003877 [Tetradesmus obliquus]
MEKDFVGTVKTAVKQGLADITGRKVQQFVHPGTLMGPAEVQLLQQRASGAAAADDTWRQALQALQASTPLAYNHHALKDFQCEWEGPKVGHEELVEKDGVMVYQQAVMWLVSGDERYAANAAGIIDAWATTNKRFCGKNAPLEAGWAIASFARAAELLKHSWPGWAGSGVEGRFMGWVDALLLPQLDHEMLHRLPLANWQTTVAECKAQLATLTGRRRLWDEALAWWHKVFDAYVKPCGECGETQRDLFHSQFGLGGLIQLAEMAWQQGLDLYCYQNSRLFTAMEFHAFITNGGKPQECCYQLKGIGFLPCGWEVGYNHYKGRMGWEMPQTAKMLAAHRPEKYVFHWGLGTLTHYRTAEALHTQRPPAPA